MKRDMELVRKILIYYENTNWPADLGDSILIEGYEENTIEYHLLIMVEAGLLYREIIDPVVWANVVTSSKSKGSMLGGAVGPFRFSRNADPLRPVEYLPSRLTWMGHDFLANAQNDRLWKRAVKVAGNLSFSIFSNALSTLANNEVMGLLNKPPAS